MRTRLREWIGGEGWKAWAKRVKVPQKTAKTWFDDGGGIVPSARHMASIAKAEPALSLDWLYLGREPDFYKSQPMLPDYLAREVRRYVITRVARERNWPEADLERWMPPGEETLDVLVRLGSERAALFATYEMANARPAPASLSPAQSTVSYSTVGLSEELLPLLARPRTEKPPPPFYERFVKR